jgi:hypothetical protein
MIASPHNEGGRAVADQVAKDLGDENTKSHERRLSFFDDVLVISIQRRLKW